MKQLIKHGKIRRDFFYLAMGVLITVVSWVGFATYRAFTKSEVSPEVKKQVVPLTPSLDLDTMNEVKERRQIPEAAWETIESENKVQLEGQLASPAAQVEELEDEEASPSGGL